MTVEPDRRSDEPSLPWAAALLNRRRSDRPFMTGEPLATGNCAR